MNSVGVLNQDRIAQSLGITDVDLNSSGLLFKIRHYFGINQGQLSAAYASLSTRKYEEIETVFQQAPSKTISEHIPICRNVEKLCDEIQWMDGTLDNETFLLKNDTKQLFFLVRWICQFAQWAFRHYYHIPQNRQCVQDQAYSVKEGKKFDKICRGTFNSTPLVTYGVKIGETQIENIKMGIYALPETVEVEGRNKFTGRIYFSFCRDGNQRLGGFFIDRVWDRNDDTLFVRMIRESSPNARNHREKNLINRRLYIEAVDDPGAEVSGDRPVLKKIVQLAIEILLSQSEKDGSLEFTNSHDQAYVFTAAGFESSKGGELREKILDARKAGKKFPEYQNERSFRMIFRSQNVLDFSPNFGDRDLTWREIIQGNPLLKDVSKPIIPDYFETDLSQYEEVT